ncbi:hypothetical protein MASR1M31_17830 [Porphyromonadaceae bacterium]
MVEGAITAGHESAFTSLKPNVLYFDQSAVADTLRDNCLEEEHDEISSTSKAIEKIYLFIVSKYTI